MIRGFILCIILFIKSLGIAQPDERKVGAWYMYFFDMKFKESSFGIQGDIQFRNWNFMGDLEQMLTRVGATFSPTSNLKLTLGYANVVTGAYGPDINDVTIENRIYQEALYKVAFGRRVYLSNRFRYEQRFVEGQNFRTRYRMAIFMNIPLNSPEMNKNTLYIAMYDEIFINGQRSVGNGLSVEIFDRNRYYLGLGFVIKKGMKVQLGFMNQTTNNWKKNQLQFSFHHNIHFGKEKEEK